MTGNAGYIVMGDWAEVAFAQAGWTYGDEYTTFPVPGTAGVFDFLADSFVLTVGAPHEVATEDWLTTLSSVEGQQAFNLAKGSIPARTDVDASEYPAYQQTALTSYAEDTIVSSLAHGARRRHRLVVGDLRRRQPLRHRPRPGCLPPGPPRRVGVSARGVRSRVRGTGSRTRSARRSP